MDMRNYYVVLGVSKNANLDKIKRAYRTVVKKHHPDVTHSQESKQRFLEIREAYETLSDDLKRRHYDEELERQWPELDRELNLLLIGANDDELPLLHFKALDL